MKAIIRTALLVLVFPTAAYAGPVYGTIAFYDEPVIGLTLIAVCEQGELYFEGTDSDGDYIIDVEEVGTCTLAVRGEFQDEYGDIYDVDAKVRIESTWEPIQYDFNLVLWEDGSWTLEEI